MLSTLEQITGSDPYRFTTDMEPPQTVLFPLTDQGLSLSISPIGSIFRITAPDQCSVSPSDTE